jgi:import receptor subunit TOM20
MQNGFYEQFPPKSTFVKLAELPSLEARDGDNKQSLRRGLVVDKDIKAGEVIYTETPLISALYPSFEVCLNKDLL